MDAGVQHRRCRQPRRDLRRRPLAGRPSDSSSPSRWSSCPRRGLDASASRSAGRDLERWTLRAALRPGRHPGLRTTWCSPSYVTTEDGTGLVHQSPAFGAEDLAVGRAYGLPVVNPVLPTAPSMPTYPLIGGAVLQEGGRAHSSPTCSHATGSSSTCPTSTRYPHCWRCHTVLIYYAQPSWYIRTTEIKDALLRRERADDVVPGQRQVGPLRRLAAQQHRLGVVAQPLLGHSPADLGLPGGTPAHVRRIGGRAGRRSPART